MNLPGPKIPWPSKAVTILLMGGQERRAWGLGFRVLGFRVSSRVFRDSGFRVWGSRV